MALQNTQMLTFPYVAGTWNTLSGGIIDMTSGTSADWVPGTSANGGPPFCRGLLIEGGGTLIFHMIDDPTDVQIIYQNVPAYYELRGYLIDKVYYHGNTCTNIHPLY